MTVSCAWRAVGMAWLLATSTASMADTPRPAASQHKLACERWEVVSSCEVSWYRLLANPAAYRGKIVGLTGYLVSDFGNLILYPDKANYESGSETASILLERPLSIPRNIADKVSASGYPVFILGRFTTKAEIAGFNTPRAGGLYDIHKIISTSRTPSDEPLIMDGIHVLPPED